jgi:hypothetical protein
MVRIWLLLARPIERRYLIAWAGDLRAATGSSPRSGPDGPRAYGAAMKEIGAADRREGGGRLNYRVEYSHQPLNNERRVIHWFEV